MQNVQNRCDPTWLLKNRGTTPFKIEIFMGILMQLMVAQDIPKYENFSFFLHIFIKSATKLYITYY